MVVLLFLLLLAALAGVLGLVLKITLVIVLTVILSFTALAWLAWRRQWRKLERRYGPSATSISVGRPARDLPGTRDDRY
jgi:positive regulator of sigma E activity